MKKEEFCTLIIMDGLGIAPDSQGNAVTRQGTPYLDKLMHNFPHTQLTAHGEDVGVIAGQMGDSEVGHLNIGSGRVVQTSFLKVNKAIETGLFFRNEAFLKVINHVKLNNSALHLMGLLSDGGVHSHTSHLKALLAMAKDNGVSKVYVHVITDGRDTPTNSGIGYVSDLQDFMQANQIGTIASVCGRLYAMDREDNYDRTLLAYQALVFGKGQTASSGVEAVKQSYAAGVTDEFLLPTVVLDNGKVHTLDNNDGFIFFNFRKDRPRQIMSALCLPEFDKFERKQLANLKLTTMTQVKKTFTSVLYAFDDDVISNGISQTVSENGYKQLKVAETTKYAHVTYYLNGTIEPPFEGEDRVLIETMKLKDFSATPQMRAKEITQAVLDAIDTKQYKLIVVNLSNCDMVGHTGSIPAAMEAVRVVDECTNLMAQKTLQAGGCAIVTADHGNAEQMLASDGTPHTAHSTNPVPLVLVSELNNKLSLTSGGKLADIAPTILALLGIKKPTEMTGSSLV